jgi:hypothetical protein
MEKLKCYIKTSKNNIKNKKSVIFYEIVGRLNKEQNKFVLIFYARGFHANRSV